MNLAFFTGLPYDMIEAVSYYLNYLGAKTDSDVIRIAKITCPSALAKYKKRIPAKFATALNYMHVIEQKAIKRGSPYHYGTSGLWLTNGTELADVIRMCGFDRQSFLKNFDGKNTKIKKIWDGESVIIRRDTMATVCRLTGSYPEEIAARYDPRKGGTKSEKTKK